MGRGRFRQTTTLSFGLTAFIVGLASSRLVSFENAVVFVALICLLAPLLFCRNLLSLLSISIIGILLGLFRGSVFLQSILPYGSLAKRPVTITATATSDAVYGQRSQLTFDVGNISLEQPINQKLVGTIGVGGFGQNMIYRGDKVRVQGKLYPTRGSRQARISFAQIRVVEKGESGIDKVRRRFAAGLQSAVPEPLGSFGLGILIGQRTTLPDSLNDDLSIVGLTHVVAVSGYNLTIMVHLAQQLARKRSKYQSTILTLSFIGLFLVITGSSASIVRAAIVSTLSLWAWCYGRKFKPILLILIAAALTAGWFPLYLWSDIGWHLSFLAFFGVLYVAPEFQRRYLNNRKPRIILQLVLETTAAQVMTLPLIMYIFGRLSLISLLANMLVVPLIPIAMAASFVAGLAGMIIPAVSGWFSWPATLLMTYMLDIVRLAAALPNASVMQFMSVWQLVICYAIIALILFTWRRNKATIPS